MIFFALSCSPSVQVFDRQCDRSQSSPVVAFQRCIRCLTNQYRLMQAALAGFLFQHGCEDRAVARHYLDGLFRRDRDIERPELPRRGGQQR